jgi:HAE1 family hydrophobic/amphiphilic exporter-1
MDPFIIMFTMPLMIIGVVGFYLILGEPFNMFNAIGLLVLLGVVVNNGIVLVDYTNLMVKRGHPIKEACAIAGGSRLRPILMSVLTTILGLLPMALNTGEGSELMTPIARTLVGGLTTSTIFTLFLIPVLYSLFKGLQERVGRKRAVKAEAKRQLRRKRLMEKIHERDALEAKRAAEEHAGAANNS